MNAPYDWREEYIVCEHVADADPKEHARHSGFRVCCESCYPDFLFAGIADTEWESLTFETEKRGALCVGKAVRS